MPLHEECEDHEIKKEEIPSHKMPILKRKKWIEKE